MELCVPRKTGIKDAAHSVLNAKVNPAFKGCVNLLIGKLHRAVEDDRYFRCAFNTISGYMSVLTHINSKSRYGIRRIICNAMPLKDL